MFGLTLAKLAPWLALAWVLSLIGVAFGGYRSGLSEGKQVGTIKQQKTALAAQSVAIEAQNSWITTQGLLAQSAQAENAIIAQQLAAIPAQVAGALSRYRNAANANPLAPDCKPGPERLRALNAARRGEG